MAESPRSDESPYSNAMGLRAFVTVGGNDHPIYKMRDEIAAADVVPSEPYEAGLVGRAKERSPQAWTEIYETHYLAIFRYVKARVF